MPAAFASHLEYLAAERARWRRRTDMRKRCPDCDGICDRRAERCRSCANELKRLPLTVEQRADRLRAQKRQWHRRNRAKLPIVVRVAP